MKISKIKLELALAKSCRTMSDLRSEFSSATLTRIKNDPNHKTNPKTVGKLACALGVSVEELITEEG